MGRNIVYLWNNLSLWLRIFIIVSFLSVFIPFAIFAGLPFSIAAVGGGTAAMLGVLALGFPLPSEIMIEPYAYGLAALLVLGMLACGVPTGTAALAGICSAGWVKILSSPWSYNPPDSL